MKGKIAFILWGMGWMLLSQDATRAENSTPPQDVLEFLDGSLLHGELTQMNPSAGLDWAAPAALHSIHFLPNHLDSIRFAHAGPVTVSANSRLHFFNGDELLGAIKGLDGDQLEFSTWFGAALKVPRASVQSITFLSSNYTVLYEGPGDAEGWIVGNHNPESWTYRDGVFTSGSPGTLGRNFNLADSSTIEFDLEWNEIFALFVNFYSDVVDQGIGNSYVLEFTRDTVNLRHTRVTETMPVQPFGAAKMNLAPGRNKIHITIQSNKTDGTVAVYVDNVLVKRWKDENGLGAAGGGLLFQHEVMTGATLKLSNFKISQWSGHYEPETAAVATNTDAVRFINHDQAAGKISGIAGGKIAIAVGETALQIPLARVTQINFATNAAPNIPTGPWEVRAHFPRGGTVSFQLDKWNDKEVSGRSDIFGPLAFQPGQIRQLEFNLGRVKAAAPLSDEREFDALDE